MELAYQIFMVFGEFLRCLETSGFSHFPLITTHFLFIPHLLWRISCRFWRILNVISGS